MHDGYSLSKQQAFVCRLAAAVFALASLFGAAAVGLPIATASGPGIEMHCGSNGCFANGRPDLLLPEAERAAITRSPAAASKLATYASRRLVRIGVALIAVTAGAPFVLLMLFVAKAVVAIAARENGFERSLPWLRRASFAALGMALIPPIADSLLAMLLMPGTPSGPSWYFVIDVGPFITGLLLAVAAFIVSWALAAGSCARAELNEFV